MAGSNAQKIYCCRTRIGSLFIYLSSSAKGAARIGLALRDMSDCRSFFQHFFPRAQLIKDKVPNLGLIREIEALLRNRPATGALDLDFRPTDFQHAVYTTITGIPFGQKATYGEVASMLHLPGRARAVGQALRANPFPIVFPCHRVVSTAGLGGFSGGLEVKRYLLDWEAGLS